MPLPLRASPAGCATTALLSIVLGALAAGCGYSQDVPKLPAAARSLAVGRIQNLTEVGELDVRLRGALQRRLEQLAHVQLLDAERSDLLLDIDVVSIGIGRTIDPALTSTRTFTFSLSSRLSVTDQRSGRMLIENETLNASVTRQFLPPVRETPALRDAGLNDAIAALAEQVEQRLLRTF